MCRIPLSTVPENQFFVWENEILTYGYVLRTIADGKTYEGLRLYTGHENPFLLKKEDLLIELSILPFDEVLIDISPDQIQVAHICSICPAEEADECWMHGDHFYLKYSLDHQHC